MLMTPKDMLELYRACMDDGDDYARELEGLLRRDWAVRVLDAHMARGGDVDLAQLSEDDAETEEWDIELRDDEGTPTHAFTERTADAARHAAALAVFPTLDRNAPNWPGERP